LYLVYCSFHFFSNIPFIFCPSGFHFLLQFFFLWSLQKFSSGLKNVGTVTASWINSASGSKSGSRPSVGQLIAMAEHNFIAYVSLSHVNSKN
jgi:hypothetical protein